MHSVLKDNNKLMPLFIYDDGEFYFGVSRGCQSQPRPVSEKTKEKEAKDIITDYIKIIDDINNAKDKLSELENKKNKLEKELLNNPITKVLIEEINKAVIKQK